MKRCPQCNFSQPDDTYDFCPKCGSKLEAVIKQEESPQQEQGDKSNASANAVFGILVALAAVITLVIAIVTSPTIISKGAVNKALIKFCETELSEYEPYEAVLTGFSVNDKKGLVLITVDAEIDFDRDITEAEYDEVYDTLYAEIFTAWFGNIQITGLDVRDTSGNDYQTGYWDKRLKKKQKKTPYNRQNPTPVQAWHPIRA